MHSLIVRIDACSFRLKIKNSNKFYCVNELKQHTLLITIVLSKLKYQNASHC